MNRKTNYPLYFKLVQHILNLCLHRLQRFNLAADLCQMNKLWTLDSGFKVMIEKPFYSFRRNMVWVEEKHNVNTNPRDHY